MGQAPARAWIGPRYIALAAAISLVVTVLLAIPTAIVENPFFTRMTPVEPEQYFFWLATGILTGALLATYLDSGLRSGLASQGAGAGLLAVFAIGCPICNKLVVGLLGVSGALTYFAPVQPILGAAAVGLAAYGLRLRFGALRAGACAVAGSPRS